LGTYCGADKKCDVHAQKGAACSDTSLCDLGLQCVKGICSRGGAAGAACNTTDSPCDSLALLACNPKTSICEKIDLASTGQACGALDAGYAACSAGASCVSSDSKATTGTCQAAVSDGASCQNDGQCLSPASCVGGTCKVQEPGACK
jgi:hypothetical protein